MAKPKPEDDGLRVVQIIEAKPNKMFTEEQRSSVRFLRFDKSVACAECGKKRKIMWTSLYSFEAKTMQPLVLGSSDKVHPPLTPVCSDHPIGPAAGFYKKKRAKKNGPK